MQILAKTDCRRELPRDNYWRESSFLKLKWNGGGAWDTWFHLFAGATTVITKSALAQLYNDSLALLLLYFNINYHTLSFIPFNLLEVKVCNIFKALDLHSSVS